MGRGKVIIHLFGGLGNQMFIYATGRALALRTNSELIIDNKSGFKRDFYKRHFELANFNITAKHATKLQCFDYKGGGYIRLVSNKIGRHIPFLNIKIIKENNFEYNENLILKSNNNCLLIGYWQTEKYFEDYSDIIRKDFKIKTDMTDSVLKEASEVIALGNRAVALGVRRYQEVKKFVNIKLTGKDYYLKAMDMIAQKIENPVFVCFTQDQQWVKENLTGKFNIKFVEPKDHKNGAIEDLYLMKLCKHFIISNSTFYWWGAWLAENNNKVVITPNNWVNRLTPNTDWIVLEHNI